MTVFSDPDFTDHEQVCFCADADSGLRAIVAIHDTTRGPALGGCRIYDYDSETAAVTDALRLARGMTYKSALADLPLGGGKAVILADARTQKTEALLEAFGRAVDRLGGRYITAEDVGSSIADLEVVRRVTPHVAGITEGGAGDPSPATAFGVFEGLKAAVRHRLGTSSLDGVTVAVQGLGHVGLGLAEHLAEAGAHLIVADLNENAVDDAVRRLDATPMDAGQIHRAKADVFAPCAMGAVLNDNSIPELAVPVVAGAANNQLAEARHGAVLRERGILYAPDYAINAGGIVNISHEATRTGRPYDRQAAFAHVARIGDTLTRIFEFADAGGIPTSEAADLLAEQKLAEAA